MIWFIGLLALVAIALIVIGHRAMNAPGQSADMRVGGAYPSLVGIALLVVDVVVALIWLIVLAVK